MNVCARAIKSQVYYLKLKNVSCISLVDTPGLSDSDNIFNKQNEYDNIHLKYIEAAISEEKIHIKGILFLTNFQCIRLDKSEQEALINYNKLFPLRKFWKRLILIFTHYYQDPDVDTLEEIIQNLDETNGEIFSKIMDKVKNISDIIDYKDLKIKYYNLYSIVKKEKQKINNKQIKEELEILLNDLCQKEPLFSQIEVIHVKNQKIKENDKNYLVEYENIGFFDLNSTPLKEKINIIKKEQIDEKITQELTPIYDIEVYKAQKNNKDCEHGGKCEICGNIFIKKTITDNSKYLKGAELDKVLGASLGKIKNIHNSVNATSVSKSIDLVEGFFDE